jgi:hypothetical protein
MAGGLVSLMTYGADDLYLTGAPQITMFKTVYRRHTNFSKESIVIQFGAIDFGKETTTEILHAGDLLSNTYIQIEIPRMHILKTATVVDLTEEEMNVIETPYHIIVPEGQPNFMVDYALVKKFMTANMAGYRKAIKDVGKKNQTVIQYINTILDEIQKAASTEPEIIQNYNIALTNALNYELQRLKNNKLKLQTLTDTYNAKIAAIKERSHTKDEMELRLLGEEYERNIAIILAENTQIYRNISALDYKASNITYILNNLLENPTLIPITVNNILTLVNTATKESQQVINYYFENVKIMRQKELNAASPYAKFAWVKKLGHAIIDFVEVRIGGETIDKHYGDWINIWNELTGSQNQIELYNKMIGNVTELTIFDRNPKPAYTLYIPLSFWFCRKNGLAFPLIALQFNKFYISIKLKRLEDCAYIEALPTVDQEGNPVDFSDNALQLTDIWDNLRLNITGNLLADFVYLEEQERKRFARSAHEYLIETIETKQFPNLTDVKQSFELNFTNPSKEIIWVYQKNAYTDNYNSNLESFWFNYSIDRFETRNPILHSSLIFGGYDRFSKAEEDYAEHYFNFLQPHARNTRTPSNGINCYSFALYPEDHQPSGACNFTKITYPKLNLTVNPQIFKYKLSDIDPSVTPETDQVLDTDATMTIYSIKYQVLRIISGMAAFAYA